MSARLLEGRPVAEAVWAEVEPEAAALATAHGRPPTLALVRGEDEAAAAYARQIGRAFQRRGLAAVSRGAPATQADLVDLLRALSADRHVDGVLLLTPLPAGLDAQEAILALDPRKDVDGQHPQNAGALAQRRQAPLIPSTALGGLRLLQYYQVPLRGQRVVVVGRSPVVGLPLALLLLGEDATVTVAHSRTADLPTVTHEADVLCVAVGRAEFITRAHVRPGAVVMDFGTNPGAGGSLVGDVEAASVIDVAGALTPVPGGAGPVTVAVIAQQTLRAAQRLHEPWET